MCIRDRRYTKDWDSVKKAGGKGARRWATEVHPACRLGLLDTWASALEDSAEGRHTLMVGLFRAKANFAKALVAASGAKAGGS
eukprot:11775336-Alexandrium_andersonii.AAC.1